MDDEDILTESKTAEVDLYDDNRETKSSSNKKYAVKKKTFMLFSFFFVFLIFLIFIFFYIFAPQLTLKGDYEYNVEYGSEYEEPGYKATYFGKDITDKVYVTGKVDTKTLGTNQLKYNIRKNRIVISKKRYVRVVDTTKPEIVLEGEETVYTCPNKKYKEEGYKATDLYDGELTEQVEVTELDNEIQYAVSDSNGNRQVVARKLVKEDKEKPVITLKGNSTVYVTLNNKYTEPGYTAIDNCDDDITKSVKVTGEVKTGTTGTYTLTYEVTDAAGNKGTATRKVVVQKTYTKVSSSYGCGTAGTIYLTFDDGPSYTNTTKILNVLKKYGVKATFFVVGKNVASNASLIKREKNEGHAIGIHTYSHEYSIVYKSSDNFWNEVNKTKTAIKNAGGGDTTLIRFPGGASNTVSRHYSSGIMTRLSREVIDKGYNYFDWNISSGDAGGLKSATFSGKVSEEVKNVTGSLSKSRGNVILMHDIKDTTASAIESIVKYGINNGYKFDVLNMSINCKQGINN